MQLPAPAGAPSSVQSLLGSRTAWLLFLAAQALFVLWVSSPWIGGDTPVYLRLADGIRHGCFGQPMNGACLPDALRPPGYPLILAGLASLPRPIIVAVQLLAYAAALFAIDRSLTECRPVQLAFRLLTLIYPFAALYAASLQTEAWAACAVTVAALLLCARPLTAPRLAATGVLLGLAGLIRTDLVLLPIVTSLAAALIVRSWRALLPVVTAALVIAPYAAWNGDHFGRFTPMPVASALGNSLYLATWQQALSADDLDSVYSEHPTTAALQSGITTDIAAYNRSFGAEPSISPFNPAGYPTAEQQAASSSTYRVAALQRIAAYPATYAWHVTTNLWALWNSSRYPIPAAAPLLHLLSWLGYLLGLVGAVIAIRTRSRFRPALAIMAYPMLVHLPFHTEARYTASVRPLLLLFAAIALGQLWTRVSARHRLQDGEVDRQRLGQARP